MFKTGNGCTPPYYQRTSTLYSARMSCDMKQFSVELCSTKEDAGDELVGRPNCGRSLPAGISFISDIQHGTYSTTRLNFFGIDIDGRDLYVIRTIQIVIS
ncbi:hypothetical protein TNIN_247641 [Trichonephila inaurata madagascariensis]|uniref:Uncharacterized protein n=1 Tax=Trichonephila inaurata madagascariensis TaxID=2747483 RepID=A0A8X6Y1S0_9ARAC|nr:hypothetical protein TNIN_247641 [Trichonephila inaurata madagascariensis]